MSQDFSQNTQHGFRQSYLTGTDHWSQTPYTKEVLDFARKLPHKGMVLDLGSGRGEWAFTLADLGMKVIGLDFIEELTHKNNELVKERGYAGKLAFKTGNILNIPFQDQTFDAVVDIGTLQHQNPNNWENYKKEILRVLKHRGIIFLVQLSRHTQLFLTFRPSESTTGNAEFYELPYHFFDKKEFEDIFGREFSIIQSEVHTFPEAGNHSYIFTLLQKK